MSLTVTEAIAVNQLLAWLGVRWRNDDPERRPDRAAAIKSAKILAKSAKAKLLCGVSEEDIKARGIAGACAGALAPHKPARKRGTAP